ncbi:MAG: HAMP domain-containing sensor histidine kinase [candidate division WOR-3 bacterium]
MVRKSSYPRDIAIVSVIFIFLIIFLALVNLYISIQLRKALVGYHEEQLYILARLCSNYLTHPEREDFFKKIGKSFNLERLILTDSLDNKIYDSAGLSRIPGNIWEDTRQFIKLPEPGKFLQIEDDFVYHNPQPNFYLYLFNRTDFLAIDSIFRWHIIYITISLVLISFLAFFLIRNLFLPMRYVANLAQRYGIEMDKEDFIAMTFGELFSKIKEKEKELRELSAYIAHEFRNSLATISGLARLIEKGKKEPVEIIKECKIMENMITSLLEYSRPVKLFKTEFFLIDLLEEGIRKINIPEKIKIVKEYHYQDKIHADHELLLSAIINILKNSVEAIPDEGTVKLTTEKEGNFAVISIMDTGRGIPQEEIPNIFSPFYSSKKDGVGLGLALVKKVIDLHEGKITVRSELSKGTEFVIRIPIYP